MAALKASHWQLVTSSVLMLAWIIVLSALAAYS